VPESEELALERQLLEVNERIGEVEFHVQELRGRLGREPATLLGVPVGASRAVAQQAYHRLAKVLHPDRLPPELPTELAREAGEVFVAVTAAFQVLSGEKPDTELAKPARPHPAFAEEEQAKRAFLSGRDFISKRNYWAAADSLRQAVRLRPREAVYRQYLGTALMLTKRLHEAEEHLVEATRIEPANPANYIYLGRMYRNGRLYRKAREAFERALRLDPRNATAREELKDLPEESVAARRPGGSFFRRLFGKE
jgi:tetratricopeptide (TPR) repeat protein